MTKSEIRQHYLELRKTLSSDEVLSYSTQIFDRFLKAFDPSEIQKVHLFLSIAKFKEVNTELFISYFLERGIRVFVPKMVGDTLISIELKRETPMALNSWGILEPTSTMDSGEKDFDLVITPLLYCDLLGNRVGYGKGFYDRFFASLPAKTKKVGVGYFDPVQPVEDVYDSDVPLDYLVTPREVLSFIGV
ncbi:5-formyltetrahydrofolate cyclo-ligase [Chryseobacterium sp. A301]